VRRNDEPAWPLYGEVGGLGLIAGQAKQGVAEVLGCPQACHTHRQRLHVKADGDYEVDN
jgi:hypothetical protein